MGGVIRVVRMTMMTMTENSASGSTPSCNPIVAKIKPTSPRGTIPTPMTSFRPLNQNGA